MTDLIISFRVISSFKKVSFAIEKDKVLFKKKLPQKELVDVTQNMIKEVK